MKVILQQDVKKLGAKGDIVDVSDGYGRNFLLPKKLAVIANTENLNLARLRRVVRLKRLTKHNYSRLNLRSSHLRYLSELVRGASSSGLLVALMFPRCSNPSMISILTNARLASLKRSLHLALILWSLSCTRILLAR